MDMLAAPNPSVTMTTEHRTGAQLIATNIRRLRLERGLTQQELAVRLGVQAVNVVELENGSRVDLTLDDLDTLAAALDAQPYDLFVRQLQ